MHAGKNGRGRFGNLKTMVALADVFTAGRCVEITLRPLVVVDGLTRVKY